MHRRRDVVGEGIGGPIPRAPSDGLELLTNVNNGSGGYRGRDTGHDFADERELAYHQAKRARRNVESKPRATTTEDSEPAAMPQGVAGLDVSIEHSGRRQSIDANNDESTRSNCTDEMKTNFRTRVRTTGEGWQQPGERLEEVQSGPPSTRKIRYNFKKLLLDRRSWRCFGPTFGLRGLSKFRLVRYNQTNSQHPARD